MVLQGNVPLTVRRPISIKNVEFVSLLVYLTRVRCSVVKNIL